MRKSTLAWLDILSLTGRRLPTLSNLLSYLFILIILRLIKDFELEARTDGMPASLLAERKRELVSKINEYIAMKKELNDANSAKQDLFAGAGAEKEFDQSKATMQQLVQQGHKELNEIDSALDRQDFFAPLSIKSQPQPPPPPPPPRSPF